MNGDQFKKMRRDLGLSINGSSRELGVSPRTIARWQSGQQRIPEMAVKLLGHIKQSKIPDSK